jgi:hypothetical protein
MTDPAGESKSEALKLAFDRRLILRFRGSVITSDGGLLAYRELDDALALTASGGERLAEARTGRNRRHLLVGLLRQSVFGRLAGYEDVNDADRLCRDPAMRWVVGGRAPMGRAASASQMGRFETEWLTRPANLAALADLLGQWIDAVHQRRPPRRSSYAPRTSSGVGIRSPSPRSRRRSVEARPLDGRRLAVGGGIACSSRSRRDRLSRVES